MKKLYLTLILLLLGVLIFFLYKKLIFSSPVYEKAEIRPVKRVIYASGYVRPVNYVVIKAEVAGYVKKIYAKEGDFVRKGSLLAELEPRGLPAQLAEIERRLALVEERLNPESDYLQSIRKEVEVAKREFQNEGQRLKRREELFREGLIAREDLEEAQKRYENARDTLEKLQRKYEDTIKSLVTERKILLEQKRFYSAEWGKYLIRAPITGTILNKYVEEGEYVNPLLGDNKLFSMGSSNLEVILEVDEEYAGLVREKQKVFLSFDSYPEKIFEGELFQVIREIDKTKRSFIVKVKLKESLSLPAQATAEANILLEEKKALVVPIRAIKDGGWVEVRGRGKVRVQLGERYGDYIEVLKGLKEGEEVRVF